MRLRPVVQDARFKEQALPTVPEMTLWLVAHGNHSVDELGGCARGDTGNHKAAQIVALQVRR